MSKVERYLEGDGEKNMVGSWFIVVSKQIGFVVEIMVYYKLISWHWLCDFISFCSSKTSAMHGEKAMGTDTFVSKMSLQAIWGGTGVTGREGAKDVPKPPEEVRRSGVWQSALLLKRCEIWHPTVLHIYGWCFHNWDVLQAFWNVLTSRATSVTRTPIFPLNHDGEKRLWCTLPWILNSDLPKRSNKKSFSNHSNWRNLAEPPSFPKVLNVTLG